MAAISIQVTGMPELQRILSELPDKIQMKFVKHGMKAAGKILLDGVKRRVPVRSAALKESIVLRAMRPKKRRFGFKVETPTREELAKFQPTPEEMKNVMVNEGYYPMVLEYGSARMKAKPYLRPAMDELTPEMIQIFTEDLQASVAGIMSKGATSA